MSMTVILGQVLVLFLQMGAGWAAARTGVLPPAGGKLLSDLIMGVTLPCAMLASADLEEGGQGAAVLLPACLLLGLLYLVCTLLTMLLARGTGLASGRRAVLVTLAVLPNSTFVGIPLAAALLGEGAGGIFGAAGMVAYNLFFFGWMERLFDPGARFTPRRLLTPANLATLAMVGMLAAGWHFSGPLQQALADIGACTTPLALMLVGLALAQVQPRALLTNHFLYLITALRGLVFPLGFAALLWAAGLRGELPLGVVILASCPSGSLGAVLAEQKGVEPLLAGQAVAHSTLFSLLTLPLTLLIAGGLLA